MISRRSLLWGSSALAATSCVRAEPTTTLRLRSFTAWLPLQTANDVPFDPNALEGRVVLITFIATWCFPCLTDLVTLSRLERDWKDNGFSSVLVGMDLEGRKVLEPFALGYKLTVPLIVADDALRSGETPFGRIRELPTRLLFARTGELVTGFSGNAKYEDLERLVASEVSKSRSR